jgi:outer membrane immunogenic protein
MWPCVAGGRDLYVGSRIGVVVGGKVLVYAKAGYANSRVDPGATFSAAIFPPIVSSRNLDGIRAGAGLEIGLGGRVFVKTEYRYINYEDGFDRHQLVGGVGLRF